MATPFQSPIILSYCTGFRGLERGIERAIGTTRTAVYVEIEAFIIENLLVGMEQGVVDAAPIWSNIKTFDAAPFRDKIHGIIGGYPCQPFSNAGNRKGTEDPRHLWPYLERDIRTVRPIWCFFENVGGHLSLGFDVVRQSLSDLGYAVEAGIFTAEEVGAPHRRERLFILAIRKNWMGNTTSNGYAFRHTQPTGKNSPSKQRWLQQSSGTNNQLAYPQNNKRRLSKSERREYHPNIIRRSKNLEYSESGWSRRLRNEIAKRKGYGASRRGGILWTENDRWPSRPGQPQHQWEQPRTIKPGMGSTIDGYNFREDLLRAYGNSVVEQTAELALKTLLKKFGYDT